MTDVALDLPNKVIIVYLTQQELADNPTIDGLVGQKVQDGQYNELPVGEVPLEYTVSDTDARFIASVVLPDQDTQRALALTEQELGVVVTVAREWVGNNRGLPEATILGNILSRLPQ